MHGLCTLWSHFCILFQPDWPTKLILAHGVVCGMEYLHSIRPHPVIHGDLKIQNVLVGDDLVAKVCVYFVHVTVCFDGSSLHTEDSYCINVIIDLSESSKYSLFM